jgi:hypothetical protein
MSLTKVSFSMITGSTINVADFGALPTNGRAANNVAFQAAFDFLRDLEKGGTLTIPAGEYDLSANLTLLADVEMDARGWIIEGNGATLNWANSGLTTGAALEIGATGNNFTYREASFIAIRDLRIIGPETQNCAATIPPTFPTEDTDTTGLKLNNALDVVLDNIFIRRFYRGIYARQCWPITANAVNCSANYVGIQLGRDCTLGTWTGCSIQSAAYCLVLQPDGIDEAVVNQTFIGMRFENSLRGITMDQRTSTSGTSATIRHINIISPYFEAISYDLLRMGQAWEYANISVSNPDRNTAYCQSITVINGFWEPSKTLGFSVRASSNGFVRGCDFSIPVGTNAEVSGLLSLSRIFYQPSIFGGLSTGQTFFPSGTPQIFGDQINFNSSAGQINWDVGGSNRKWLVGTGTPEGAVTAPVGSLFTRSDGGAGTTLYIKESGTGNTGWVAK